MGGGPRRPGPHFLSGYPVDETGEPLHPEIALILPSRPDWNGVPRNVAQQFVSVRLRCSDKLPAQRNSHFEIDLIGVYTLFRLRLYHRINESTGQKVIQRRYMELIHPVWNPVVADKGRKRRIAGEIDCCTVHRKKTVSVEHLRIDTSGIKRIKDSAEHSWVDLSAALADGGRGDFNPGGMENLI